MMTRANQDRQIARGGVLSSGATLLGMGVDFPLLAMGGSGDAGPRDSEGAQSGSWGEKECLCSGQGMGMGWE